MVAQALELNVCGSAASGLVLHKWVLHLRGHSSQEEAPADGSSLGSDEAAAINDKEEEEKQSDSEPAGDFAEPDQEADFGNDGLHMQREKRIIELNVEYETKTTEHVWHVRFLPGKSSEVFNLHSLEPWELHYANVIELDFKARGSIFMLLLVADVATGALHIDVGIWCIWLRLQAESVVRQFADNKSDKLPVEAVKMSKKNVPKISSG